MAKSKRRVLLVLTGGLLAYTAIQVVRKNGSLNPNQLAANLPEQVAKRLAWLPLVAHLQTDELTQQEKAAITQEVWYRNQASTVSPPPVEQDPESAQDISPTLRGEKLG